MGAALELRVGLVLVCACGADAADGPAPVEITQTPSARFAEPVPSVAPQCRFGTLSTSAIPSLRVEVVASDPPVDAAMARATIAANDPPASDPDVLLVVAQAKTDLYRSSSQNRSERSVQTLHEAIRTWAMLIQSFPNYHRMDEVLYQLGWGLSEMEEFDRARQVFHRLIRHYPTSPRVPTAYVHFGDYYLRQGDASAASRFFERASAMVAEDPELAAYVRYGALWARRLLSEDQFDGRAEFLQLRDEMNVLGTPRALRFVEALDVEWCQQPS